MSFVEGAGGATTLTIPAQGTTGSLEILVPDGPDQQVPQPSSQYRPAFTRALTAVHGGSQIGESIDLTAVDDEPQPRASITEAPSELAVDEGDSIDIKVELDRSSTDPLGVKIAITDADGALSGTPTSSVLVFVAADTEETVTFTAAENTTQNDGAHDVMFTLELRADEPYTLGDTSSVTVTVRDDDTPPLAPQNLRAQAGNTEATLRWDPPAASTPDHEQPVLHYEYRVKVGTGSFSGWAMIPGGDASTRSHTFTGLPNDTLHTYEVRAENVAGDGAEAQVMVTPIVGVAVSFGKPRHELGCGARRDRLPGGVALRPALQQSGEPGPEPADGDERDASARRVGARSDHGAGAGLQQQRGERVVGRADVGQPFADAQCARHGGERG